MQVCPKTFVNNYRNACRQVDHHWPENQYPNTMYKVNLENWNSKCSKEIPKIDVWGCVPLGWSTSGSVIRDHLDHGRSRVRKYARFGVFYAKIVQMTPLRLRRESLWLQKFSVTNREPLRLQKFSVTNTVLSLPFSQQIQFTLIVNVVNLN